MLFLGPPPRMRSRRHAARVRSHRNPNPATSLLVWSILAAAILLLAFQQASGAPVWGEVFTLQQPDGAEVKVKIWGDEFYRVVESLDGYTLVRDPESDVICFARLSADSNELESTGVRFDTALAADVGLDRHLRINPEAARAQGEAIRAQARVHEEEVLRGYGVTKAKLAPPNHGDVQAICLIIDFSDEVGTVPPADIDDLLNLPGYTGYGNNGSVRDYFHDVSDGDLTYTNFVPTAYYRANQLKSYYDNCGAPYGVRAREMIIEALNDLDSQGFDFSQYDSNGDGFIDGINCFYAGVTSCGWAQGLWPHSSSVTFVRDGVQAYRYQITGLVSSPTMGTFVHENGHMLCFWPDLYDYDGDSRGVGRFCVMCNVTSSTNPQEPCAYLKYDAGWTDVSELITYGAGLVATADSNAIYKYSHPTLANEYYLVENRQKTGRDLLIPDAGLAIWHIDTNGNNSNQEMTPSSHYLVTLVQADGDWDLENNMNSGDNTDLWSDPGYTECTPETNPNTNWWDGSQSTLAINDISGSANNMTFTFNPAGQSHVPGEYATIQSALDAAALGETVVLADGVYTGPGNRDLDCLGKPVTVRSASGDPAACVIDCQGSDVDPHRGFLLDSGETATTMLQGFTIRGGYAAGSGGGVSCDGASPTLRDIVFDGNESAVSGGGASFASGSQAILEDCVFQGNVAPVGGGVFCLDSSPSLDSCTLHGNSAGQGGGVACDGSSAPVIISSILSFAPAGGSVACLGGGSLLTISCCDVFGNVGGDWIDCIAGLDGSNGNFSLDPLFCDAAGGDLTIREDSPCAPGFHPNGPGACSGEKIGARSVGCFAQTFADATSGPLGDSSDSRGAAWGDYDGDGDHDLYIINHGQANRLLRNDGGGVFTDVSSPPVDDAGAGNGAAWADYDNDGDLDLYLANENQANHLYRNDGGGTFSDVTTSPLDEPGHSVGVSWADYDHDGLVDLYVVDGAGANKLFRNFGDVGGTWFFLLHSSSIINDPGAGSCASWGDFDNDGFGDVYITNQGTNRLIQNWGPLGFFDSTGTGALANGGNGMGSCWGDYDNNGYLDLFVVNDGSADLLLRNSGSGFILVLGTGVAETGPGRGSGWADYDNDGDLDLYLARYGQGDRLVWNLGSDTFSGLTVGGTDGNSNAVAWCDYDSDGKLDVYLACSGNNLLLRNDSDRDNHWLQVDLRGVTSNSAGIGARVRIVVAGQSQIREITAGSGYLTQHSLTAEFGLGGESLADSLIVDWPSGTTQIAIGISADQRIVVTEGSSVSDAGDGTDLPARFGLGANVPNPFNPVTAIRYELPERARVNLRIYDLAGRLVRVLRTGAVEEPGYHQAQWYGRDDRGRSVASGTYFYKLEANEFISTRRMLLIK